MKIKIDYSIYICIVNSENFTENRKWDGYMSFLSLFVN